MSALQDSRILSTRSLGWIGGTLFSACIYNAMLALFSAATSPTGVAGDWLITTFGLGILFFGLGFVLGPIAFAYLVLVLGDQLKDWVALSLRWVWCCPSGGSGGVGLLVLGSAFVGANYSTYLIIRYVMKKRFQVRHVVIGSVVLAAFWLVVVLSADAACIRHFCPRS